MSIYEDASEIMRLYGPDGPFDGGDLYRGREMVRVADGLLRLIQAAGEVLNTRYAVAEPIFEKAWDSLAALVAELKGEK